MNKFYIYGMAALLGAATIMQSCSDDDVVSYDDVEQAIKQELLTADQVKEIIKNNTLSEEEIKQLLEDNNLTEADIKAALEESDYIVVDKEYHTVGIDTLSDYLEAWNGGSNAYIKLEDVDDSNLGDVFHMFDNSDFYGNLDLSDCEITSCNVSISGSWRTSSTYKITSLIFPKGLESIPYYFAQYNNNLKSVTFNKGITKIPSRAFYYCTSLTSVTLPEGLKSIGDYAFDYCTSLKSFNLPSTLETIGAYSFYGTTADSITIPASIKTISNEAFYYCPKLKAVTFLGEYSDDLSIKDGNFGDRVDDLAISVDTPKLADGFTIYVYDLAMANYLYNVNSDCKIVVISDDGTMTNYEDLNAGK